MRRRGEGSAVDDSSLSPLDSVSVLTTSLLAGEDARGGGTGGSFDCSCSCTGLVCGLSDGRNSLPGTNLGTLNSMMVGVVIDYFKLKRCGQKHAAARTIARTLTRARITK